MANTTNYARGLTASNAKTLGTETFTVTDLSTLKKTAEGYPIPPSK